MVDEVLTWFLIRSWDEPFKQSKGLWPLFRRADWAADCEGEMPFATSLKFWQNFLKSRSMVTKWGRALAQELLWSLELSNVFFSSTHLLFQPVEKDVALDVAQVYESTSSESVSKYYCSYISSLVAWLFESREAITPGLLSLLSQQNAQLLAWQSATYLSATYPGVSYRIYVWPATNMSRVDFVKSQSLRSCDPAASLSALSLLLKLGVCVQVSGSITCLMPEAATASFF
ncbi:uncharacterized protein MYCFIDRAFT_170106 [Pseudocercospora fijiensis CIRAD86]|uniref:Uncharacterized protein n=1 Tax=Pseudocercospora fijiensis (strain CIRAD86) TaxID=383855 RepID=N1QBF4_PSEFD|nr:uncharacterized protein MYCFIDRAFT_170106 [Pseudocercospora fijiensis CIRAD86]EME88497.1 hypothetical protein MYCFIDRAFT_170106 [Pseudocercospora fijiensis CIRAD86]